MIVNLSSGGLSPNYKVIGATSAPSDPAANTIWINTATTITGHIFSYAEPDEPYEGLVWLLVSNDTTYEFSAFKEKTISVYPYNAAQYNDGRWVEKRAKIYYNDVWCDWYSGYLYKYGDMLATTVSGGWSANDLPGYTYNGTVTLTDGYVSAYLRAYIYCPSSAVTVAHVHTANTINVDGHATLTVVASAYVAQGVLSAFDKGMFNICVWAEKDGNVAESVVSSAGRCISSDSTSYYTYTVDVSGLSGDFYVGFKYYETGIYTTSECFVNALIRSIRLI